MSRPVQQRPRRALARTSLAIHLAAGLAVLAAGCSGNNQPTCYPVRGQVLRDGAPLAEALVAFHPLDQRAQVTPKPVAYCDEQGRFHLMTFRSGDGAPAGRYAITVELRAPRQVGEELVRDGENLLPPRLANPTTSKLEYEVVEGENEVPPLAIDGR
jgi:hypothetical protein